MNAPEIISRKLVEDMMIWLILACCLDMLRRQSWAFLFDEVQVCCKILRTRFVTFGDLILRDVTSLILTSQIDISTYNPIA